MDVLIIPQHNVSSRWSAMPYSFFCWLCSALYRGVIPGITGSMVTGATYFGFIESTKDWLEDERPNLAGPWAHFCAGAIGTALNHLFVRSFWWFDKF